MAQAWRGGIHIVMEQKWFSEKSKEFKDDVY